MKKQIKAWAIVDNKGRQIYYYGMFLILPTKERAKIEQDYYNAHPLNHDYEISSVLLTFLPQKPKSKKTKKK